MQFVFGLGAGILISAGFMVSMNYLEAKDMLAYCADEGWEECRIEYDGLVGGFNVYCKGE